MLGGGFTLAVAGGLIVINNEGAGLYFLFNPGYTNHDLIPTVFII